MIALAELRPLRLRRRRLRRRRRRPRARRARRRSSSCSTTTSPRQRPAAPSGTDFDGRSDYGPFIAAGIPAGGLFTGAEGIKTAAEAAAFGGTAGVAYDPCYHEACDTIANINDKALAANAGAITAAALAYARSRKLPGGAVAVVSAPASAPGWEAVRPVSNPTTTTPVVSK